MPSDTEIANLAITLLGTGKRIGNLTTENSPEANAVNVFFTTARDKAFEDFPWPFATRFVALALIEEDPTTEWNYSYGYPSTAVTFRRILSGVRNDSHQSKVRYRIVYGTSAREIYTDEENAVAEFTFRVTDTGRFPPSFVLAFAYKLAELIAPALTGGDPFDRETKMKNKYHEAISEAWANAANEEVPDEAVASEFERERE
jgi:hypothetical protein